MAKQQSRKKQQGRRSVVAASLGEAGSQLQRKLVKKKNPAAVALGKLGGLKGGRARADKLSAAKRSEIASRAANARWSKEQSDNR